METIEIIHDAVHVKKATLIHNTEDRTYHLIHYDTEIMTFNEDKEIFLVLQCSATSTKAIMQVADHFGIDHKQIRSQMVPYRDFYKYPVGI